MKKKIIGIVVLMLLATTVVSAANINVKEIKNKIVDDEPYEPTLFDWFCVDQKQTHTDGFGITLGPPATCAQSFTPKKDKLTAVSLYIFKHGTPPEPVHITVSIRDNLTGSDLATKTIDTSVVSIKYTWVMFDFEDISITPGDTYFIVCSGDGGAVPNVYCWFYSNSSKYSRGEGWYKGNQAIDWITLEQAGYGADYCFKTYFRKPLDRSDTINNENPMSHWVLFMLRRFPNAFPILKQLIGL